MTQVTVEYVGTKRRTTALKLQSSGEIFIIENAKFQSYMDTRTDKPCSRENLGAFNVILER